MATCPNGDLYVQRTGLEQMVNDAISQDPLHRMCCSVRVFWLVLLTSFGCRAAPSSSVSVVAWNVPGPRLAGPRLLGHTNTVVDVIGPVDGSAELTILTEGNHFPALLPLVLDEFPSWCASREACRVRRDEILVITLPQFMVVDALESGGLSFGTLRVPLRRGEGGLWPDIVMAGVGPLRRLAVGGYVGGSGRSLARHQGMGLLVRRDGPGDVQDLPGLVATQARLILASSHESGARRQYLSALSAALPPSAVERLLAREVDSFPGRLTIQHRDVPYALLAGYADAGLIFVHLAQYWAQQYPEHLAARCLPDASRLGQEILVASSSEESGPVAKAFMDFLFEKAPEAYVRAGFSPADSFSFGEVVEFKEEASSP